MSERIIYIGADISGIDEVAIEGGETPLDFHVTLLYGYAADSEKLRDAVHQAVNKIKDRVPLAVVFDNVGVFSPSKGSDGKHVIYAKPSQEYEQALWRVHYELSEALAESGVVIRKTHETYRPHLTLAYVDEPPTTLPHFNVAGKVTSITYGIGQREQEDYARFQIVKSDNEKRLVFGWASISIDESGAQLMDLQGDMIDPEDLEATAYQYVLDFRDTGEEHIPSMRNKGRMVESCVFTKEKQAAIGIPEGTIPVGWWIGFYIDDEDAWERIKSGQYQMFSVEGSAIREPVEKHIGKTFMEILENEQ